MTPRMNAARNRPFGPQATAKASAGNPELAKKHMNMRPAIQSIRSPQILDDDGFVSSADASDLIRREPLLQPHRVFDAAVVPTADDVFVVAVFAVEIAGGGIAAPALDVDLPGAGF